jgi:hypothetical protein
VTTPSFPRDASPVEVFRFDLLQLYYRAGRPSFQEMSRASGRPPVLFGFLNGPGLPGWDEVTALLTATGNRAPSVVENWRRRWARLDGQRRRPAKERPDHEELTETQSVAQVRDEGGGHQAGPLNTALAASTPGEFAAALEQLRLAAGVSYGRIAKWNPGVLTKSTAHRMATSDKLPHRRVALVGFVRACRATEAEAQAWWSIVQRIRRGESPLRRDRAIPAADLLRARGTRNTVSEVDRLRAENAELRQMLDSAVRAFRVINAKLDAALAETVAPAPNGVVETLKTVPVPRPRAAIRDEPAVTYHADTNSYRIAG